MKLRKPFFVVELLLVESLVNCDCNGNRSANHWVVSHSKEAHHLNVCWNG